MFSNSTFYIIYYDVWNGVKSKENKIKDIRIPNSNLFNETCSQVRYRYDAT